MFESQPIDKFQKLEAACKKLNVAELKSLLQDAGFKVIAREKGSLLIETLIRQNAEDDELGQTDLAIEKDYEINKKSIFSTAVGDVIIRYRKQNPENKINMIDCLSVLLRAGVKPNRENIILALRFTQLDLLAALLRQGGKITNAEISESGIENDINEKNKKAMTFLVDKELYDVNAERKPGFPLICQAALGLNVPLIKFLLANGANTDVIVTAKFEDFSDDDSPQAKEFFDAYIKGKSPGELCKAIISSDEIMKNAGSPENLRKISEEALAALNSGPENTREDSNMSNRR